MDMPDSRQRWEPIFYIGTTFGATGLHDLPDVNQRGLFKPEINL
jgi:hypothetical protein